MVTVNVVLMLLALVSFLLAAAQTPVPRVNLVAVGLAFWVLALILR